MDNRSYDKAPRIMENREFVELEEEDIQKLNHQEAAKFDQNPQIKQVMAQVEDELGDGGHWEEHWFAADAVGSRVYARIYYTDDQGMAVTSNGEIIKEFNYPPQAE
jgi:hypothetical protein